MKKSEIIKSNKLIAEFMGYKYIPYDPDSKFKAGWWKKGIIKEEQIREPSFRKIGKTKFLCRRHPELRYYNSWDWLIPVLNKIGKVLKNNGDSTKVYLFQDYYLPELNIKEVWENCITFIEWYNENNLTNE
ncbi:MAG: hypothetical protein ACTH0S_11365 [Senegalia sp. (in: firmicutes)]